MPDEPEAFGLLALRLLHDWRAGRTAEARAAYDRALALVHDEAERWQLERRLTDLGR